MSKVSWVKNTMPKSEDKYTGLMGQEEVETVLRFHKSFPQYTVTPLAALDGMAKRLGLKGIYVKDESYRFGLNAFKVLGGSYAMARHIASETGRDISRLDYAYLTGEELRREFGQATFFTATDGNHGRGVAWAAAQLGQKAVVHMPKGTVASRFDNIKKEGATVTIEDMNYDDCVRLAARGAAETPRGVVVQDTAWPGYEEIPSWIMQGYGTMAREAAEQLQALGVDRPTHVLVQAGVGSLAGAVVGYYANLYRDAPPKMVVMEADAADCLYKSALAGDGEMRVVKGDLSTMMAGLACGEPNGISWDILRNHACAFVSCSDPVAARGMRMLAAPVKGDPAVTSGESGAVGMGLLWLLMQDERYRDLKETLDLGTDSRVLFFSTEGDTDPVNYEKVVWGEA